MMGRKGWYEDLSSTLFLMPFIASGIYAIYLWALAGPSLRLPTSVYLKVTRDPTVFLVGTLAVLLALIVDLWNTEPANRRGQLALESGYLQRVAAASFVLALVMAWYANGFLDVSGTARDFFVGRFSLVFPTLVFLLSYLITTPLNVRDLGKSRVLGIISMLLVPAVVYELGKRNVLAGLVVSAFLIVAGLFLFLRTSAKTKATGSK
ncbi:MAG: hypothetical protein LYZ70_05450 [Nitrososphaerales archaeon]|nr:hypothetical protein [Nitrososphaerales archaeon]